MKKMTSLEKKIIFIASIGTVFEAYDFYLFGFLALIFSKLYFTHLDPNSAFILSLLAFASGFLFRPLGAMTFGYLGDTFGRKLPFLLSISIMGLVSLIMGLLPTYQQIGLWAPVILVSLRILQGFGLGGEYGGAVIYIAELAPANRRGEYISWSQIAPSIGYFISISSIVLLQIFLTTPDFNQWGWRILFLMNTLYLFFAVFLRKHLQESKTFENLKASGRLSKSPINEIFSKWLYLKKVLICLFGGLLAQATLIPLSHLYFLYFLTKILKVESFAANLCLSMSLIIYIIFILLFSRLSDWCGRRPLIILGCFLALISIYPVYNGLVWAANPQLAKALTKTRIVLKAPKDSCHFNLFENNNVFGLSLCDQAKKALVDEGLNYEQMTSDDHEQPVILFGQDVIDLMHTPSISETLRVLQKKYHYPEKADMQAFSYFKVMGLTSYLLLISAMFLGPMACFLVEIFPARIRYTGLSFPFHFANGVFGGLFPAISFSIITYTGNFFSGIYYAMVLMAFAFLVCWFCYPETKEYSID